MRQGRVDPAVLIRSEIALYAWSPHECTNHAHVHMCLRVCVHTQHLFCLSVPGAKEHSQLFSRLAFLVVHSCDEEHMCSVVTIVNLYSCPI